MAELEKTKSRRASRQKDLSDRQWGYLLLFNGFIYLAADVFVIGEVLVSGKASTLPWLLWVGLVLVILAGMGSFYYGMLRLNRAKRRQESDED